MKFRTLATTSLSLLAALSLTGCQNGMEGETTSAPIESKATTSSQRGTDPENPTQILYSDFNQWAPDFQLIRLTSTSGAVYVNEDPAFTKDGKGGSALFRPIGSHASGSNPIFIFPTHSSSFNFDYRDFSDTRSIDFELYNAENHDLKVAVGLTPSISSIDTFSTTKAKFQTLPAKTWTTISYEVNQTALSFLYDVTLIDGFYIEFENIGSRDEEDAPHIYLDEIKIQKYLVAPPIGEGLQLKEMEYLDFEDPLQEEAIDCDGPNNCKPDGSIVEASAFGLNAPSGDHIYHFGLHQGQNNDYTTWNWVTFSNLVTKASALGRYSLQDAKDLVISFDVYNDSDATKQLEFDFLYYSMAMMNSLDVAPKTWMTFNFSLKAVLEKWAEDYQRVGQIRFVYPEYTEGGDFSFFLDNIRFNWASEFPAANLTEKGQ